MEGTRRRSRWGRGELVRALEGTPSPIARREPLDHAARDGGQQLRDRLGRRGAPPVQVGWLTASRGARGGRRPHGRAAGNLRRLGVHWALTGPIERGDAATVRAHLEAIAGGGGRSGEGEEERLRVEGIYRVLGLETLRIVAERYGGLLLPHQGIKELLEGVS